MLRLAEECVREGRLWHDAEFAREGVPADAGGEGADGDCAVGEGDVGESAVAGGEGAVRWLSLAELFGDAPHVWPDGRRSYLYMYSHHASELAGAKPPGGVMQVRRARARARRTQARDERTREATARSRRIASIRVVHALLLVA